MAGFDAMAGMKRSLEVSDAPPGQRRRMDGGVADDDDANLEPPMLVKKLVAGLKSKMTENMKKRAEHAGEPDKFMESELALDEELEKATTLAVNPSQYPLAVRMGLVDTIVQLTLHGNNDILCSVMLLLSEITDADIVAEDEAAMCLHEELVRCGILGRLLAVLEKLSGVSEDEKEGVLSIFSTLENLTETQPQVFFDKSNIDTCKELSGFLLRSLLKQRPLDDVKTYSAELLSAFLQISPPVCSAVVGMRLDKTGLPVAVRKEDEIDGVHALCECLAKYVKNRDSVGEEEELEYIKDIYDSLGATLLSDEGKAAFCKAQGVMLMFLLIRKEKKKSKKSGKSKAVQHVLKHSSLKCLVHALQESKEACVAFVKHDGLGIVASFLMMVLKGGSAEDQNRLEGHAVSIFVDLLRFLEGDELMRCVAKFSESEYEKSDRVVELLEKAVMQLATYDQMYELQRQKINDAFQLSEEQHELERLDNGYLAMRQLSIIIARLCVYDKRFVQHFTAQLKVHSLTLNDVSRNLREASADAQEDTFLSSLLTKFAVHADPPAKDEI